MVRRQPEEYNFKTCDFDERILPAVPDRTTYPRRQKIQFVVLHHMAMKGFGESAISSCLHTWASRPASAHYCVADGFIAQAVWDTYEAWATANSLGNQAGISIEHANSTGAPTWQISAKTLVTGAKLVAALHHFHKLGRPVWGKTLFQHRNFYNTACAGPYLGDDALPQYVAEAQHQYDLMEIENNGGVPPLPPTQTSDFYVVVSGDTLGMIARRFGVTTAELVKWNKIADPNKIEVGQRLRIKASTAGLPVVTPTKPLPNKIVINDARITEASGIVLSANNPGCYWMCNDEPGRIWLVRIVDGAIVGSFMIKGVTLVDEEALAYDYLHKTIVVLDGGNNKGDRKTAAYYTLPEPVGEKHHGELDAIKTTFAVPDKANFEAFFINPTSSQKYLVSKAEGAGHLYKLNGSKIVRQPQAMPALVSDGCYSPTGKFVYMVRKGVDVIDIFDARTFQRMIEIPHPDQPQPETIALYPNGMDVVVGSEGARSKLLPVRIPPKYL